MKKIGLGFREIQGSRRVLGQNEEKKDSVVLSFLIFLEIQQIYRPQKNAYI